MAEEPLPEDYACLDLSPESSLPEVELAYRRFKALYAENALATYSLFDEKERLRRLEGVEQAYRRITGRFFFGPPATPRRVVEEPVAESDDLEPDRHPGRYLRCRRQRLGLSLKDISERTKIGRTHLQHIEDERFERLPAPVYLRGFLTEYVRFLGLENGEELIGFFLERQEQLLDPS